MTKEEIGQFVKQQRMLQNMTQQELGDRIGGRRQSLIEIENSQCNYGINGLLEVLATLGFTLVPTVSSIALPGTTSYNFSRIEPAQEKDDPSLQERKKERIFAQSNRKNKKQQV